MWHEMRDVRIILLLSTVILILGLITLFVGVSSKNSYLVMPAIVVFASFLCIIYYYIIVYYTSEPKHIGLFVEPLEIPSFLAHVFGLLIAYIIYASLFSLLYLGLSALGHNIIYSGITPPYEATGWDFLYFSITTASTLGFGDLVPQSGLVRFLAMVEVSLGPLFLFSVAIKSYH